VAYRQGYLSQGDPFLPGLFAAVGLGKKAIGSLFHHGGAGSKQELADLMKQRLSQGTGAVVAGAKAAAGFVGRHKGLSAAAAAALAAGVIPAGYILTHSGKVRRKPHMQVANTRALRRSMRRVQGFARLASRTMSFTKRHHLKKHKRR
jgi:hypothetical protein